MSNYRKIIQGIVAAGLMVSVAAVLLVSFAAPAVSTLQMTTSASIQGTTAPHSLHAKNRPTPDWILELQARNARQLPLTVESDEPSFWI